jgi:hypothetical protein
VNTLPAHLGLDEHRADLVDWDIFESIVTPGKLLLLCAWTSEASIWSPHSLDNAMAKTRHRRVRIIRDYGMFDRAEAPQYFPEAVPKK